MNTLPRALTQPVLLGESPLWDAATQGLYFCDIAGQTLHSVDAEGGQARSWPMGVDLACCALRTGGGLLLARRDGLWAFDPATGACERLAQPPYDPAQERFNDGKCDPRGRFWVGTIYEPRQPPRAALYRWHRGQLDRIAGEVTVSNGLAWSPDGRTMYWSDTTSHTVWALDYDLDSGQPGPRRVFARFPKREAGQPLADYGGRPDGAAVDAEGAYWVAMYEGGQLLRLAPDDGRVLDRIELPVRCPTMPCFGGHDLRTLYITTVRHGRPPEELQSQPQAGAVFAVRVAVPGIPVAPSEA